MSNEEIVAREISFACNLGTELDKNEQALKN